MKIEARNVRGTKDLFGDEAILFRNIINEAWQLAEKYNYTIAELPIFEFIEVFQRTMGESSDVVKKEIYSFTDRSDNEIALRPEFTASIMRAIHSNKLLDNLPLKLFSAGPVFRYDRPQKCRQRQFNQINFEIIGTENSYQDGEIITMCMELLNLLEIKEIKLHINSLGNTETRKKYTSALIDYLSKYKDDLSEDSKMRLEKNPLRILDTKDENDKKILLDSPEIGKFYDSESRENFEKVLSILRENNIDFQIDNKLVRGLDYYDYTVFEIITESLGAQGTIIAGGRYNNLSTFFGNKQINCFGCAGGVERLMALCNKKFNKKLRTAILALGSNYFEIGNKIANQIRNQNKICDLIIGKENDLKKLLTKANKMKFNSAIIIGENEIKNNSFLIKNLDSGEQISCELEKIFNFI